MNQRDHGPVLTGVGLAVTIALFVAFVLSLAGCAHVPTREQQIGLARQAAADYSTAFREWYVAEVDAVETQADLDRLGAVRRRWDMALEAAVVGIAAAEARNDPGAALAELARLAEVLREQGVPVPGVRP